MPFALQSPPAIMLSVDALEELREVFAEVARAFRQLGETLGLTFESPAALGAATITATGRPAGARRTDGSENLEVPLRRRGPARRHRRSRARKVGGLACQRMPGGARPPDAGERSAKQPSSRGGEGCGAEALDR